MPPDRKAVKRKLEAATDLPLKGDFATEENSPEVGGRHGPRGGDAEPEDAGNTAKYTPPEGYMPFTTKSRSRHFDASAFGEEENGKELWLIRVPDKLRLDSLNNVTIKIPSKPSTASDTLASVESNLHSLNHAHFSLRQVPQATAGEMAALEALLPSSRGKLVRSATGFARYFLLSQEVEFPDAAKAAQDIRNRPLEVKRQPAGLKMRFKPYGFDTKPKLRKK